MLGSILPSVLTFPIINYCILNSFILSLKHLISTLAMSVNLILCSILIRSMA
ncbi:UNVERIFIED_CONTAM: hypothetical protein GTU68_039844 [Idotea baltica]|nr:hypothetical protein [Idotea baltica]